MAADNRSIGRFQLSDIPPAPRGVPQIEVSFDIDANGIINVSAADKATGKEQRIRIEASSGLSDAEIQRMKDEAAANADADKEAKEKVEVLNQADSLVFQTEKQMADFGDKIPEDKKAPIEAAIKTLKEAHVAQDVEACKTGIEDLNQAFSAASEEMYKASQEAGGAGPEAGGAEASGGADEEVTDVDFEEVSEEK